MKIFLTLIIGLLFVVPVRCEGVDARPVPESIPVGKGSLEASGKFVPNDPQPPNQPVESREQIEAKLRELLHITQESPHCFRIGGVSFDRERRTVTIPAVVNMDSGVVEYGLVAESGKVHEALFVTTAKPEEIHLACLLLGVATKGGSQGASARPVNVSVKWETNGPTAENGFAHFVMSVKRPDSSQSAGEPSKPEADIQGTPLASGAWTYVGSVTDSAGFAASREGSIISIISDDAALINNPRANAGPEIEYRPNNELLPKKGNPVSIVLTFAAASTKSASAHVSKP
jgi:hypothetical protein